MTDGKISLILELLCLITNKKVTEDKRSFFLITIVSYLLKNCLSEIVNNYYFVLGSKNPRLKSSNRKVKRKQCLQ